MQRRAVAVYVALFLLIGAASYTLIATAEKPEITLENPDYRLSSGDEFTAGNETYTVKEIKQVVEESHGSTTKYMTGQLTWTATNVPKSTTWAPGDTVTVGGREWTVVDSSNTSVMLEAVIDKEAILKNDPDANNQTYSDQTGEFVIVNGREIPSSEYFSPETVTFGEGDTIPYEGTQATIDSISNSSVSLSWTTSEDRSTDFRNEGTTTLADGTEYLAFFPNKNTLILTSDMEAYQNQVAEQETFKQRVGGLSWITFTAALISFLLIAFAFLPSRY
ncbi:MAG: hypothetical protein ABEH60_06200 [Halonotius sp.]